MNQVAMLIDVAHWTAGSAAALAITTTREVPVRFVCKAWGWGIVLIQFGYFFGVIK